MKKIFSIILLSVLLTSCCCSTETKQLDPKDGVYLGLEKVVLPGPEGEDGFTIKMERFMLYGHDYIIFYYGYDHVNQLSFEDDAWIHDPNCRKCNLKSSENLQKSIFDW